MYFYYVSCNIFKKFFHKTVEKIRSWGVYVPIIAGGPYATGSFKEILKDQNIDLIVHGEGELTFYELVNEIIHNGKTIPDEEVLSKIKGISYVSGKSGSKNYIIKNTREILKQESI